MLHKTSKMAIMKPCEALAAIEKNSSLAAKCGARNLRVFGSVLKGKA